MKKTAKNLWCLVFTLALASFFIFFFVKNNYNCKNYFGPNEKFLYYPTVLVGVQQNQSFSSISNLAPFSAAFDMMKSMEKPEEQHSQLINQADFCSCENPPPDVEILSVYHFLVDAKLLKRLSPKSVSTNNKGHAEFVGTDALKFLHDKRLNNGDIDRLRHFPDFIFKKFKLNRNSFKFAGYLRGHLLFVDSGSLQLLLLESNSMRGPELQGQYKKLDTWQN